MVWACSDLPIAHSGRGRGAYRNTLDTVLWGRSLEGSICCCRCCLQGDHLHKTAQAWSDMKREHCTPGGISSTCIEAAHLIAASYGAASTAGLSAWSTRAKCDVSKSFTSCLQVFLFKK